MNAAMTTNHFDLVIIGAGPTGLACGIEAQKAGLSYLIIEKGALVETVRRYPVNMTFFSTPELLTLDDVPFTTTNVRPTRREALQYYRGVAEYYTLNLRLHTRVERVTKQGAVFEVLTHKNETVTAPRVVIATGYFDFTNRLLVEGEDLPHVSHYYDEPYRYSMTDVVVIGGRNSAVEAALELWRHKARVTMVHRGETLSSVVKYWVKPDIENRLKNGEIIAHLNSVVREIREGTMVIENTRTHECTTLAADFVFPLIGYRPDETLLRGAGVQLSDKLVPEHNPTTFETNVEGLYIAGSVACGCETWAIFIENGRMHAKPVIEHILQHQ